METFSSTSVVANAGTRAWVLTVAGYSLATLGLLALLTINGVSGITTVVEVGTAALVVIGLLLTAAGMLRLRSGVDSHQKAARDGLAMQAIGLVGLLLGVVPIAVASSLSFLYVLSAVLIVASGVSALAGAFLTRSHASGVGGSIRRAADCLILGTALIFAGVALILASNAALYFVLSSVGGTVYTDIGATISACGCVIAAYSIFAMRPRV